MEIYWLIKLKENLDIIIGKGQKVLGPAASTLIGLTLRLVSLSLSLSPSPILPPKSGWSLGRPKSPVRRNQRLTLPQPHIPQL